MAAQKLAKFSSNNSENIELCWRKVFEDFHHNKYWGFPIQSHPTPVEKKPTIAKTLFGYIWAALQSLIVMKLVILYFGLQSAADPDPQTTMYLIVAVIFSFGSLGWFAWHHSGPTHLKVE